MICIECRAGNHRCCDDTSRWYAEFRGEIPGVALNDGRWCDCQHKPRDATS